MTQSLLIDEQAGIYVPRNFYLYYDFPSWGLDLSDYSELSDPYNDDYWEAWDQLLAKAKHLDEDGNYWRLEQDGSLFAVLDH